MTTIELSDEQRQALQAEQGKPLDDVDRATKQRYVLLLREQFDRLRTPLEPVSPAELNEVPPGILRSQQAFWRDLPELLKNKKDRGRWVCYRGDVRIGVAESDEPLIRECIRRNIPDDEYGLFTIEPRAIPPWIAEETEPMGSWHLSAVPPAAS